MGFAALSVVDITGAQRRLFRRAIEVGFRRPARASGTRARAGLAAGRPLTEVAAEIETAAALSAVNPIVRSYLGKAYFDERRESLAGEQFALAKDLDPLDPTAFSLRCRVESRPLNRPVEALQDLQKVDLTERQSRGLPIAPALDQRPRGTKRQPRAHLPRPGLRAAGGGDGLEVRGSGSRRSTGKPLLFRYLLRPPETRDCARERVATVPASAAAQYLPCPAKFWPKRICSFSNCAGPSEPAFNEFNPLFNRNRLALLGHRNRGRGRASLGDEVAVSGVWNRAVVQHRSVSLRTPMDFARTTSRTAISSTPSCRLQLSPIHVGATRIPRRGDVDAGDLVINFDPTDFSPEQANHADGNTVRFGLKYVFNPNSLTIVSAYLRNRDETFAETPDRGRLRDRD